MTIPRITGLLIMLALGHDALALQMGQISSVSVRGQPLTARVALYGMSSTTQADLSAELLPAFGAPADSLSNAGLQARIESDDRGAQAIVITTSQAYDAATLALRVRLHDGARAMLRHYELNIPAAPAPRAVRPVPQDRISTARRTPRALAHRLPDETSAISSTLRSANYGPVRVGQSLWSILKESGLAVGDSRALMQDIVVSNPHAFVGADPARLRVGVMLTLPGGAPIDNSVSATTISIAPRTDNSATDAATAARLERLAVQFAEIRTRYAKQQQHEATALSPSITAHIETAKSAPLVAAKPESASLVAPDAAPSPTARRAALATESVTQGITPAKPMPKTVAKPASAEPESLVDTLETYVDRQLLMGLGTSLLVVALLLGARFGRRLRSRIADAGVRSADRELVAEITRKAEKRVQLEGEVKRMIAGRRDNGDQAAANAPRPPDLLAGGRASLEDIETRIAHGQYNEAEAMLEQTIADTPNNYRAKLRLAEIYYLNERHEEFVDLADEIHRQHRSDIGDENWARLMRMGKVIAPERPPFSGPVAVEAGRRVS